MPLAAPQPVLSTNGSTWDTLLVADTDAGVDAVAGVDPDACVDTDAAPIPPAGTANHQPCTWQAHLPAEW